MTFGKIDRVWCPRCLWESRLIYRPESMDTEGSDEFVSVAKRRTTYKLLAARFMPIGSWN